MKKIYLVSSILVISQWALAQIDRSIMPKPTTPKPIEFKESEVFLTKNGIKVILSENHKVPKVSFDLTLGYNPGLENEKAGLGEIAGALVMSGTKKRSKDELDKEVDFIGASLNASSTNVSLSCMTKHLDKGLDIMSDVVLNSQFPISEFERIVKQYQSNLLSLKSEGDAMANNAVAKVNFPNHPYGEVMTNATLASIGIDDVKSFIKSNFIPEGAYLVIVGDINRMQAEMMVEKYFGSWTGAKPSLPTFSNPVKKDGNQVYFINKPGAVQSVIQITCPVAMRMGDPNNLKINVLNDVFGGNGFGTRLMQNLREDKAYTYGCYSSLNNLNNGGWISAGGNFRNAVTDSAIAQILFEFNRLNSELITDKEIELTKAVKAGNFARSLERPQTVARFAFNIEKYGMPKDYYKNYLQALNNIKSSDLKTIAESYYTPNNYNIIVVGNEEVLEKIKAFDSDGKVTKLDEFGDVKIDMLPSDISFDVLMDSYLQAVTLSKDKASSVAKIKAITSCVQTITLKSERLPYPIISTEIFTSKGVHADKLNFNGMLAQKNYFDGVSGYQFDMQKGKKEMDEAGLLFASTDQGLFPEANFTTPRKGINCEILGIEQNGSTTNYVVKITAGGNEVYNYYDKTTFLKVKSSTITNEGGETNTTTEEYSDFKEVNGVLFPHKNTISLGELGFNGTMDKIEINTAVDLKDFQ